ncbi:DoxX family membrane protein [Streptomyces sp. A3M-1-3]|uniref:DoxX family membrane protein n=1 Tax=Streptomyces sp. A3M-1-3 TaxID=2962044 RepID=UPI0020B7D276|nr:DoxX family membrane protein [Streptomyces sp. A3M-1-3]MCP3821107.1 DoxX family membrane protein [Streptomyces sp. A3M-1-3]
MSVDTRTPRFDDQPAPLSMVKVPCDPAQVIVNHASFRVQLATGPKPRLAPRLAGAGADTSRVPAMSGAAGRRRAPVVWSGKSAPGDPGATGLLQAVRDAGRRGFDGGSFDGGGFDGGGFDGGATQVIPRIELDEDTRPTPTVVGPRNHDSQTQLLPHVRTAVGAYDEVPDAGGDFGHAGEFAAAGADGPGARRHGADPVRHAYYPGRRMNLGVVLLPLRVFLGFISIYAGMGKLCDPVYFDGGERGSMVKWLQSLHPWALAEPLRDFALSHPVGAGLTVAFLQVVVGVLTVLGLWQRFAACFGAVLSAALLMTVTWKTVPAYDAPDIIYLAAWSPLIIAGAPVYSVDGRLAGEAWRRLGPRSELWELRRRVLRRGGVMAAVVVGLTLLVGSVLGGAVRSATVVTVPGPGGAPSNHLPGSPLPQKSKDKDRSSRAPGKSASPSAEHSAGPTADKPTPEEVRETGSVGAEQPTETQGTGRQQPRESAPQQPPAGSSGPSSSGGTDGGGGGGNGGGSGGSGGGNGGSGGGSGEEPGRLVGGLLG